MASVTFNTSPEEDKAVKAAADAYNAQSGQVAEGVVQFFRRHVQHKIDFWVSQYSETEKLGKAELYQRASAADKATIDAVLAKYQV